VEGEVVEAIVGRGKGGRWMVTSQSEGSTPGVYICILLNVTHVSVIDRQRYNKNNNNKNHYFIELELLHP